MKYARTYLLLFLIISAGCAFSPSSIRLEDVDVLPQKSFETYLYSAGIGETFRAVLLKDPESPVVIVPYSVQIRKTTGTFDDAMLFMARGKLHKGVHVQSVIYNDEKIGYLLVQPKSYGPYYMGSTEVHLFERNGKIYFDVDEKIFYGD
jgi:hypothetical protein